MPSLSPDPQTVFTYRVGRIGRPHGLRGELVLQLFRRRDRSDVVGPRWVRLRAALEAELEHPDERLERVRVTHIRWVDPLRTVLRLDGVQDRLAAERLLGCYFDLDPGRLVPELNDDVDGCFGARVLDAESGTLLGSVFAIRDNGAQPLLEIVLAGREEPSALVPVVPELVPEIDSDAGGRYVRIRPLPGLLEVNT